MSIYNRWTYFNVWLNKVYFCIVVANGLDTYYVLYMGKTWNGKKLATQRPFTNFLPANYFYL